MSNLFSKIIFVTPVLSKKPKNGRNSWFWLNFCMFFMLTQTKILRKFYLFICMDGPHCKDSESEIRMKLSQLLRKLCHFSCFQPAFLTIFGVKTPENPPYFIAEGVFIDFFLLRVLLKPIYDMTEQQMIRLNRFCSQIVLLPKSLINRLNRYFRKITKMGVKRLKIDIFQKFKNMCFSLAIIYLIIMVSAFFKIFEKSAQHHYYWV